MVRKKKKRQIGQVHRGHHDCGNLKTWVENEMDIHRILTLCNIYFVNMLLNIFNI